MNINNRDKNIEVSFLQSYLADKIDLDVAVSGTYDLTTHKRLIQYLQYPEIKDAADVRDELSYCTVRINATTQKLFTYVFSIQINSHNITCTQKSTSYLKAENGEDVQASYLSDSLLDTIKPTIYKLGWDLSFEVNNKSKFIVYLTPSFNKSTLPRKTLLPMVNLAGMDYLDNWEMSTDGFVQSTNGGVVGYAIDLDDQSQKDAEGNYQDNQNNLNMSQSNTEALLSELKNLAETGTKIKISLGDFFDFEYPVDGPDWLWVVSDSDTRQSEVLNDVLNSIVKQQDEKPVANKVRVSFIKGVKRLYIINNIDQSKSYAIMHSLDGILKMRIATCEDFVTSRRIREREHFSLSNITTPTFKEPNGTVVEGVPQNNVFFVHSSKLNRAKSIIIEITKPQFENYQIGYVSHDLYGDMNGNGYYDDEDLIILNEYLSEFPEEAVEEYEIPISNKEHFDRMTMCAPSKMFGTSNALNLKDISTTATYVADMTGGEGGGILKDGCLAFDRYAKTNIKEEYIFVGQVDDDLMKLYYDGKFEDGLYQVYYDIGFHDSPFLVHSQLIDFLLDTSIHKYSEEERIFMVQKLVGMSDFYNGYTDKLREIIRNIQKDNSIPFQTGYADSSTLFILREGE